MLHTQTQGENIMSTVESKHGAEILKQTQAMAEMVKDMMPKVNNNKNGYEIRAKILQVAKDHEQFEYHAKVDNGDKPRVPGVDDILETANKLYDFVNDKK